MGSALLRKPDRLATLVRGISERSVLPLTVKVRTIKKYTKRGWGSGAVLGPVGRCRGVPP